MGPARPEPTANGTLTVGELVDAAMRVRQADLTDLCEIDLQRLVVDSTLLAEFVLIACRDEADGNPKE